MKKLVFIIMIMCFTMGFCSCGSEKTEKDETKTVSVSRDFNGILLSVDVPSDTYKTGEAFVVTATVKNNTEKTIYLFKNDDECETGGEYNCTHTEMRTVIQKSDGERLVDADRFGKGENAALNYHAIEPGQSLSRKMNYLAAKTVAQESAKSSGKVEYEKAGLQSDTADGEMLVAAETGEYLGSCTIMVDNEKTGDSEKMEKYSIDFIINVK